MKCPHCNKVPKYWTEWFYKNYPDPRSWGFYRWPNRLLDLDIIYHIERDEIVEFLNISEFFECSNCGETVS